MSMAPDNFDCVNINDKNRFGKMASLGYTLVVFWSFSLAASQNTLMADSQCMYTFHVPPVNNNSCTSSPPSSDLQALLQMVNTLQSQVNTLTNQSSTYLHQVTNVQNRISSLSSNTLGNMQEDIARMNTSMKQVSDKITRLETLLNVAKQQATTPAAATAPLDRRNCGGATYIRWGRQDCPGEAKRIQTGTAAGEGDKDSGGGADLLCLPLDLQWMNFTANFQLETARLVGVIYGSTDLFSTSSSFSGSSHYAVPCARCHVTRRASHMMIASRTDCPSGWTAEYKGYLMASRQNTYRSSFVCVDQSATSSHSSSVWSVTTARSTIDYVEGKCGVLNCPAYVNGRELACVVCTK